MGLTIEDGAHLSIADAIDAGLENHLAAVGVRIVYTLKTGGVARPWFQCPTRLREVHGTPLLGRSTRLPDVRAVNRRWRTPYCFSRAPTRGKARRPAA